MADTSDPYIYLDQPADTEDDLEDTDIYRGEPPLAPDSPTPRPRSPSVSSTSSSDSSNSSVPGGRLGAIAHVVENAIARWARKNWSSSTLSSASSSSSSSSDSVKTFSTKQTRPRRRRRNSSTATLINAQSEREVAARIRAREELRQSPREFALYVPPSLSPQPVEGTDRICRTADLNSVICQLDSAMKKSARIRRANDRARAAYGAGPSSASSTPPRQSSPPPMDIRRLRRAKKGKDKEEPSHPAQYAKTMVDHHAHQVLASGVKPDETAWFLDAISPTWEDMRTLGKLLHIHPLTLEDILQQDPREKLEFFPKLGYYFVVFRAIEGQKTRERFRRYRLRDTDNPEEEDSGLVGEINIYLIVFREGICLFHFSDISEHTDRVRNKLLMLERTRNSSSDWIAHGLLDSVVDDIFPFVEEIETEVSAIENLVMASTNASQTVPVHTAATDKPLKPEEVVVSATSEKVRNSLEEKTVGFVDPEKPSASRRARFILPTPTFRQLLRRLQAHLNLGGKIKMPWSGRLRSKLRVSSTALTLRRIARTRRLVTNLSRLLATKSEVIARIQKRLLSTAETGLGNGVTESMEEVAMYYGDVQDHILTLQQALTHYERMLSQSHPTYLTQLRITASNIDARLDKALVFLSTVTVGVFCIQPLISLFSINVSIPSNRASSDRYIVFGIVISLAAVQVCVYLIVVRWWWRRSKRKSGRALQEKGFSL